MVTLHTYITLYVLGSPHLLVDFNCLLIWEICERNATNGSQTKELINEKYDFENWERSMSRFILSPCLFNLHAEYIMRNAGLEETQAGIKIARRNINNLRYADDTTLMAESEEELKSLLMKVKEESEKLA